MAYTIKITEKPFYKKFTYRIKITWPNPHGWTPASEKQTNRRLDKTGFEYKTRWSSSSEWDDDISNFIHSFGMFYYFNDPRMIETFEENFNIEELCKPINQEHIDVMFADTKIRIRSKLYYNRFRWAIRFHWKIYGESKEEAEETIRHWLDIQGRVNRQDYLISPHSSFIIYSNNKTDVAAIRLMFTEIDVIDEVRLIDELTEEEK